MVLVVEIPPRVQDNELFILHNQRYGCLWLGDTGMGVGNKGIDLVLRGLNN